MNRKRDNGAVRRSPQAAWFWGHFRHFGEDPLRFLETTAREFGDLVPLRFLTWPVFLVNRPDLIERALASESRKVRKTLGYRTQFMRRIFGQGLLTSEGELWTRQRRLAQPAFHRDRIASYAPVAAQFSRELSESWAPGETRNIHEDLMKLTTRVVVKALFDAEVPPSVQRLGEASAAVMKQFVQQWSSWRIVQAFLPRPGAKHFRQVIRQLDGYVFGLIERRRAEGADHGDLLSKLIQARDERGGAMSDQQLRDELVTLMVAGLDTTALAASWSLYLLAKNPDAQAAARDELQSVLGNEPPDFRSLPRLRWIEAILKESMRMYPPAWLIGREAVVDLEWEGEPIRKGSSLLMSQWLAHRDPRYFKKPSEFHPERWLDPSAGALPKFAYFPFGGGPRVCIGASLAMMEASLVLSTVLQRFQVRCPPDYEVKPWPSITLQPANGIWLELRRA